MLMCQLPTRVNTPADQPRAAAQQRRCYCCCHLQLLWLLLPLLLPAAEAWPGGPCLLHLHWRLLWQCPAHGTAQQIPVSQHRHNKNMPWMAQQVLVSGVREGRRTDSARI